MNGFFQDLFYDVKGELSEEMAAKLYSELLSKDFKEILMLIKDYETKKAIRKLELLIESFDD